MKRTWKWMALAASGGVLLQFSACLVDLALTLAQSAAAQIIGGALRGALDSTAGT